MLLVWDCTETDGIFILYLFYERSNVATEVGLCG